MRRSYDKARQSCVQMVVSGARSSSGDGGLLHGSVCDASSGGVRQVPAQEKVLSQLETEPNSAGDGPAPQQNGHVSEALHAARVASGAAVRACLSPETADLGLHHAVSSLQDASTLQMGPAAQAKWWLRYGMRADVAAQHKQNICEMLWRRDSLRLLCMQASSSKKYPFAAAENATAESFMIRGPKYMQNKKKQGSERAIYQCAASDPHCRHGDDVEHRSATTLFNAPASAHGCCQTAAGVVTEPLFVRRRRMHNSCEGVCASQILGLRMRRFIAADLYAFDFKLAHIAQHVLLPPAPNVPDQSHLPPEEQLPPLLIINIQLPGYPVRT